MIMYKEAKQIDDLISQASTIIIIQADNPDADSLGSALALEQILMLKNKETTLYCEVDIPSYLRFMDGWDRVVREIPNSFDLSIIVDASTLTLFEKMLTKRLDRLLSTKPVIVLDHHKSVENIIPFSTIIINDPNRSSAGELIYCLASELKWQLNKSSREFIMNSILGDTQGLTNDLAKPKTYEIMSDLIKDGVSRQVLEEKRREYFKMPESIYLYKAKLIERTKFNSSKTVAYVTIPQSEINAYSPLYNPAPLIQNDMLQIEGIRSTIVFKRYEDSKLTAAIRCNQNAAIAAKLAEKYNGGGHDYASGFKIENVSDPDKIISECILNAEELLQSLDK